MAFARARVFEALGDTTAALAILEPALDAAPEHVGALNLAGYLLARRNERLADADRSGWLTPAEYATTAPKPAKKKRCSC